MIPQVGFKRCRMLKSQKNQLTKSGPPPEAQGTRNQAQHQHNTEDSNPREVHGQRRYDCPKSQHDKNSCSRQDDRVVPPTSPLTSSTELVSSLSHHGSVVVQGVS